MWKHDFLALATVSREAWAFDHLLCGRINSAFLSKTGLFRVDEELLFFVIGARAAIVRTDSHEWVMLTLGVRILKGHRARRPHRQLLDDHLPCFLSPNRILLDHRFSR